MIQNGWRKPHLLKSATLPQHIALTAFRIQVCACVRVMLLTMWKCTSAYITCNHSTEELKSRTSYDPILVGCLPSVWSSSSLRWCSFLTGVSPLQWMFSQRFTCLKSVWSHCHLTPPSLSGSFNGLDNGWQWITKSVHLEQTITVNSWAPLAFDERIVRPQWPVATWWSQVALSSVFLNKRK